jgi:hypothetical protein
MKTSLLLVCLSLAACSPGNDDRKPVSTDEARRIGMHLLLGRYPNAEIILEDINGNTLKYHITTNGVTVPSVVVVDRKAAQARFEESSR